MLLVSTFATSYFILQSWKVVQKKQKKMLINVIGALTLWVQKNRENLIKRKRKKERKRRSERKKDCESEVGRERDTEMNKERDLLYILTSELLL